MIRPDTRARRRATVGAHAIVATINDLRDGDVLSRAADRGDG
ncbi:MAG TPA: hypothetical protein VM513_11180 [Kofleriaceae bacterium]|nr:hypothetical protein [Kofleriaceae bacterium]